MATWQLQDAKARLSELIETAKKSGPQVITQRGIKSAVVVPFDEWESTQRSKGETFLEVLRSGPPGELPLPDRRRWKLRKPIRL